MALSLKERLAIGISSAVLATGLVTALQPPSHSHDEQRKDQVERSVQDLGDAQEKEIERMRDAGDSHLDAENARKLVPVEPRDLPWRP
jgi:hypothetical protein